MSCSVLAACGGGGGGGTTTVAPAPATPAPLSPQTVKSTARGEVQTAMLALQSSPGNVSAGTTTFALERRVQAIAHGRHALAATGPCSNGTRESRVTAANGDLTDTLDTYYDAACTALREEDVTTLAGTSNAASLDAHGTVTTYDRTAAVTGYLQFTLHLASSTAQDVVTATFAFAPNASAAPTDQAGTTCAGPPRGTTLTCSAALVGSFHGAPGGDSLDETTTVSGQTVTDQLTASFYAGSGLGIAASGTTWAVTGGTPFDTLTGTVTFTTGSASSGTVAFSDAQYGFTESGTIAAGAVNLTVKEAGVTVATATADASGNGTVSYADGTSETIAAYLIRG